METDSAENKRKRQDSIKKDVVQEPAVAVVVVGSVSEVDTPETTEVPVPEQVSSPSKKPRTSTTGESDEEEEEGSSNEDAQTATQSVQAIEIEKKPASATKPTFGGLTTASGSKVFGMGFGGGFASAAKKASPFAAFTNSSISGFAKYAVKKPEEPVVSKEGEAAEESVVDNDKPQTDLASPKQSTQSFEAMLSVQGDQTLETKTNVHADKPINPDVPVRTFEEDETCLFSTKARLFELAGGNWKERGNGQFKVNKHTDNGRRRMVMRTDLTFRLILNAPLFSGMKAACERRFVRFTCFDAESTTPTNFALRFPTDAAALSAYQGIVENVPAEEDAGSDAEGEKQQKDGKEEEEQKDEENEDEDENESGSDVDSDEEDAADDSDGDETGDYEAGDQDEDEDEDNENSDGDAAESGQEDQDEDGTPDSDKAQDKQTSAAASK
ncbi:hypothetical protein FB645_001078 [Coemansia sp. IMI 203386]|nr:hypothetical protein FB645_001078 [Coemansia sp. IMI 203386]